jgi:Ser/Thr protein kinase RdoA (MazF antagonist)
VNESSETKFFFELTPERILDAVEEIGVRCTGRCLQLNSMENRVYEVEIELDAAPVSPAERFRIVKFYRPGRWSKEQIGEEHRFLLDLKRAEIPVVAPLEFPDGSTLRRVGELEIYYAIFPKVGGRSPDELDGEQLMWLGRLLARIHTVGAQQEATQRLRLNPATYGIDNLKYLIDSGVVPRESQAAYRGVVERLCTLVEPWFHEVKTQRIHGDCHLGNILWGREGPFFVDFDDMVVGPCVQDVWLIVPGRDEQQLQSLLSGYELMRPFDRNSLRLIEPLRALRFVHFSAWIARRWHDPAFQRVFPNFGSGGYWGEQLADLNEQLSIISNGW